MNVRLKALKDQVIVLTGASSGIGLTTARLAAKRGARLVLAARNREALAQLVEEIRSAGGEAEYVVADVGSERDVNEIAGVALERYGGFDTWINNAGGGIYGRLTEVLTEDHRRLFETNFWGVVYGSLVAVRHLGERGGALINVGSVVSDRVVPLQGMYSASKHAVKGFTDALRMELEAAGAPVSVTLIKPTSIDTPFTRHARNYMDEEPSLPPPVYAPELVAEAILHCAETPRRDMIVGGGGKMISALGLHAPRLADRVMESPAFLNQQKADEPPRQPEGALHAPTFGLHQRGGYPGHTRETSLYTTASLHPVLAGALALGAGLAIGACLSASSGRNEPE
jgi:short-subunit dehydrogenase